MKLTPFQQKIISSIEPLPLRNPLASSTNLIEKSQVRIGETIARILRSQRQSQEMVWDPWILKDGDIYRMFYLQGLEGQNPWWTVSKICGAISTDLQHWQNLGTILEANPDNDWESGRISAGCAYQEDGIYYLFYSAGGKELPHLKNEAIGLAISTDGLNFTRTSNSYLLKPDDDDPWYGRSNWTNHYHWRDPYIFKDDKDGKYYMFICASSRVTGNFQGCVGLAVADNISGSYKLLPPAVEAPQAAGENWAYYHTERPQVIYKCGKYHLFFSCFKTFVNPQWLKSLNHKRITNSSLHWYISDNVTGPYKPVNEDDFIVRGSEKTGMYGINFLEISKEPEELIAYGWYHRIHTLAVTKAFKVNWKEREKQQNYLDTLQISLR